MKVFLTILILLCFCLTGCGNNTSLNNQESSSNYTTSRITTIDNKNNTINNTEIKDHISSETEIASFSTKIYTPNDEARQNNIRITSSKLNGCIVKSR